MDKAGYNLKHYLLKGENMGVPQTRHRVFFIGVRKDIDFDYRNLDMEFDYEPVTYGEIKEGQGKTLTNKMYDCLCAVEENESDMVKAWNRLYNNNGNKRMYFNHIVVHDKKVMPTIPAGHSCIYSFSEKTLVSDKTIINSSSFPYDYKFGKQNIWYLCGMSVPPLMIKRIMNRLIESGLFDYKLGGG